MKVIENYAQMITKTTGMVRDEAVCKRRRGSAAGDGAEEMCGILLNCPSN